MRRDCLGVESSRAAAREEAGILSIQQIRQEESRRQDQLRSKPDEKVMRMLMGLQEGSNNNTRVAVSKADGVQSSYAIGSPIAAASSTPAPSGDEFDVCVECIDAPKTVALLPCKHLCICGNCSKYKGLTKCPICFEEIIIYI